ncbi:MAG: hypothetical protein K6A38_01385 [Lachnospiraceae bacterium]|nr:hypothetical protein [Lachnospiraceae bacterium]
MAKKYKDDDEFNSSGHSPSLPVLVTTAIVSGVVLVILLIVLATNKTNSGKNNFRNNQLLNQMNATPGTGDYAYDSGNKDIETLYNEHKLRAEDLDIWDMYSESDYQKPEDDMVSSPEATATSEVSPSPSHEPGSLLDGYEIIDELTPNSINFKDLKFVDNKMSYYINGRRVSNLGVMISADNGEINFGTLKSSGVDFVMIKVGSRGYDSGIINEDVNFEKNIKGAYDAGLPIGLYFCSRAVTVREAIEEADFIASKAYDYNITYPVAYVFEGGLFDRSRTDSLSDTELTNIADTFLDEVRMNGYFPVIYGSGKFLLNDIDEKELLSKYDVFLFDDNKETEFPYQFKMWQYSAGNATKGMEKPGDYVMSLVNYSGR